MQPRALLIAFLLLSADCVAQQYPFVHYTPKDGLVNSRVRKAYQDSRGRIYFITYSGLSVYDGARFKNYTIDDGLLSDLVNDVLEVGEDSLLVAVNTDGLNVLVRGKMKKLTLGKEPFPIVNQFLKSLDGNIYLSADDGLHKLSGNKIEKLPASLPDGKGPAIFLGFIADFENHLVFSTNDLRHYDGLFVYDKQSKKITDALPTLRVQSLTTDHRGLVWVSSNKEIFNLDTIELKKGKIALIAPYSSNLYEGYSVPGSIQFNSANELLVAGEKGIIHYPQSARPRFIAPPEPYGAIVQNFFVDREDIIWICHEGNGVYKLSNTNLQSTNALVGSDASGIQAVRSFGSKSFCVVTNEGRWILHSPESVTELTLSPTSLDLFPLHFMKERVYAFDRNVLYLANHPKPNEQVLSFRKILTLDSSNFGGESITDPHGNVILFESRNLIVMSGDRQISTYPLPIYDLVQGMHIDREKRLWVVSRGNGLVIFSLHPEDPEFYLKKEAQFTKEFGKTSPRCITVDKNHVLWIGTRYDGLFAFEYKNNQLKKLLQFQTKNGLTDNFVTSLACDDHNNVIVGTQTGVDRLVKQEDGSYRMENITKSNNIFSYIKNVWTDWNDRVFALTNAGTIFQIEPVQTPRNWVQPQLMVVEIRVNGKSYLPESIPAELKYYQRNINISVAAPSFIDEKQVKYSYLLEGSGNKQWSDTSTLADISLLNLSPGRYDLRVKAFFHSTTYPPKETSFGFTILPPWWQTWWFRLGMALAGILALGLIVRNYYIHKLNAQRSRLEKKQAIEKERTRIATDMHDDLGAGLSRIKFLSETIGIKRQQQQPIEEDISKIREYSHEMIDKMGEIVWALNEKNDSISDLLSYTRSYAAEYLAQNGIKCSTQFPETLPSIFVSGEYRRNVFLAVKEILHNVVKHSRAEHVQFIVTMDTLLTIQIQDDGIGFIPANARPYSNGLTNIRKRMTEMGGTMTIRNENGTVILLTAPIPL
ncbi:MAG: hypothetical protein H7Y42_02815 [Chitinophagaceae bacterium]|nr:hypothetical protein [Chitinophagaceae bacterium]